MKRLLTTMAVAAWLCLALAGCGGGPSLGSVKGQVTMDGKPLPSALVTSPPTVEGPRPRASPMRTVSTS